MTKTKNSNSIVKATKGSEVLYLSKLDESKGLDTELDMLGYTIEAL